jgi:hypothetical protein
MGIEKTDCFAEVFTKVRRQHSAHSQLPGGEITREPANVKRRNGCGEWISVAFKHSVSLGEET